MFAWSNYICPYISKKLSTGLFICSKVHAQAWIIWNFAIIFFQLCFLNYFSFLKMSNHIQDNWQLPSKSYLKKKKNCWPMNILRQDFQALFSSLILVECWFEGKDGCPQKEPLLEVQPAQPSCWRYFNIWNLISILACPCSNKSVLNLKVWNGTIALL